MSIECFNYKVLDYQFESSERGKLFEKKKTNSKLLNESIEPHSYHTLFSSLTSYKYVFIVLFVCGRDLYGQTRTISTVPSDSIQFNRLKSKLIHIQSIPERYGERGGGGKGKKGEHK